MATYKAPLRDMRFLMQEVFSINELAKALPYYKDVDEETLATVLEEGAKIHENLIQPLNQSGDQEGCHFDNGNVTTPKGFKEAYQRYIKDGWTSTYAATEYGGQALPHMLQIFLGEMLVSSNASFSLYIGLSQGAYEVLARQSDDKLKKNFIPSIVSGEFSSTMCLTEPHCGTDLGLLRTRATPIEGNQYKLDGTKIFITSGEHDLTKNIVHLVLARLPDAPAGVKGISLFLVPKFMVQADGSIGERNKVFCGSIEHKMGIKGSATCVMNFDGAIGYLIGEKHQGLKAMFNMMNVIRLQVGLQGLAFAEAGYQNAVSYAKERLQGRAAGGSKFPDKAADPIIVHPDIRRMLLTIKAFTEGSRALAGWTAQQVDIAKYHPDAAQRERAEALIALLTPVIKGFFTDLGFDSCNMALQVFGGHGYIVDYGMEQLVRDARISQIYEGTNGVQALDLVKRKLLGTEGKLVASYVELLNKFITENKADKSMAEFIKPFANAVNTVAEVSEWIMRQATKNPEEVGAASSEYMKLLGYVSMAFMWVRMLKIALTKPEEDFYASKIHTGRFFFQRMLPQIEALKQAIYSGSDVLMKMPEKDF